MSDQCERNPDCVRGFKHRGWGGHCSFVTPAVGRGALARGRGAGRKGRGSFVAPPVHASAPRSPSSLRKSVNFASANNGTAGASSQLVHRSSPGRAALRVNSKVSEGGGGESSAAGSNGSGVGGAADGAAGSGRLPRVPGSCLNVLDAVSHSLPETSLLALLGRESMGPPAGCPVGTPRAGGDGVAMDEDAEARPSSFAGADESGRHAPLAMAAFRITELAPPHLPSSFFARGSGCRPSPEHLATLVVEGLIIDASERGDTAAALWAGGNATRLRLRPVDVTLRVDGPIEGGGGARGALSGGERRTTRSVASDGAPANGFGKGAGADGTSDGNVVARGDVGYYYSTTTNAGRHSGGRATWEAWYELRTEHAVYALQLPDRTYAEWFAAEDGARLMAVAGAANAVAAAPPAEAYISFIERLLSSRVRECDLFGNARFVEAYLSALSRPPVARRGLMAADSAGTGTALAAAEEVGAFDDDDGAAAGLARSPSLRRLLSALHTFDEASRRTQVAARVEAVDDEEHEAAGGLASGSAPHSDAIAAASLTAEQPMAPPHIHIRLPVGVSYHRSVDDGSTNGVRVPEIGTVIKGPLVYAPPSPSGPIPRALGDGESSPHDLVRFEAGEEWEVERLIGRRVVHVPYAPVAADALDADGSSSTSPAPPAAAAAPAPTAAAGTAMVADGASPPQGTVTHIEYLVRWRGWSAEHATWEPLRNLGSCRTLLRRFHREAGSEAVGEREVRAASQLAALEAYISRCGGSEEMLAGWDIMWRTDDGQDDTEAATHASMPGSFVSPAGLVFRSPFEVRRYLQLGTAAAPPPALAPAVPPPAPAPPQQPPEAPAPTASTAEKDSLAPAEAAGLAAGVYDETIPQAAHEDEAAASSSSSLFAPQELTPGDLFVDRSEKATTVDDDGDMQHASALAKAAIETAVAMASSSDEPSAIEDPSSSTPAAAVALAEAPAAPPAPARCKRHRLCSRGPSHPGSCRLPPPKGRDGNGRKRPASSSSSFGAVSVSEGVVLCGMASWSVDQHMQAMGTGNGAGASSEDAALTAALRRRTEASGVDDTQCERHPLCVRGFKHGGRGGHCAFPSYASSAPALSAKRARHLRIIELNSGRAHPEDWTPLSAEDEAKHLAARERRRNSGKSVRFAPTNPPPRSPPLGLDWSSEEEEDDPMPRSSYAAKVGFCLLSAEVDASFILSADGTQFGQADSKAGLRGALSAPRPLRSAFAPAKVEEPAAAKVEAPPAAPAPAPRAVSSAAVGSFEPCERDPRCVRGFRHCGMGGRCSYKSEFAPPMAKAPPPAAATTKRKQREDATGNGATSGEASGAGAASRHLAACQAADQCERNPNCSRGFKHRGFGGHCKIVAGVPPPVAASAAGDA